MCLSAERFFIQGQTKAPGNKIFPTEGEAAGAAGQLQLSPHRTTFRLDFQADLDGPCFTGQVGRDRKTQPHDLVSKNQSTQQQEQQGKHDPLAVFAQDPLQSGSLRKVLAGATKAKDLSVLRTSKSE